MGKKIARITTLLLWSTLLVCLLCAGLYNYTLPETITVADGEELPAYPCVSLLPSEGENTASGISFMDAKLFGVVSLKKIEVKNYEGLSLIPSGRTFGVRLFGEGVCVVGVAEVMTSDGKSVSPATLAGLAPKDIILSVNDSPVKTVTDLKTAVENSGGSPISIRYRRGDKEKSTSLTPVWDEADGKYKTGMWVKDSATGIGTISFINPETGEFGALGHGVCDAESGMLLPLKKGVVTDAVVTDIVAGSKGKPGEVKGYLKTGKTGVLLQNTECGVFGVFATVPKEQALPIAPSSSVKNGKATLRTMLDGDAPLDYEIEITEVHGKSPNKSFTVRVTDPRLLSKTGGIIQGMSGSPIIQNGKLIGALTHVMINDPTHGYGIFIENMLAEAEKIK